MEIRVLDDLLERSQAEPAFKRAVQAFAQGQPSELIRYSAGSPPIKVLRVLLQLLETFPDAPISDVEIEGRSSCSAYAGTLTFGPSQTRVRFEWNCSWKAQQEGFRTWYGAPDQTRAAHEFGHRCFRIFEKLD